MLEFETFKMMNIERNVHINTFVQIQEAENP